MATTHGRFPVLTNPFLWGLVVLPAFVAGVVWSPGSGLGIFLGGVIGVVVLAVVARFLDELRTPTYDNKIDPWDE